VSLSALRVPVRARGRGPTAARGERARLPAPAVLARLPRARPPALPAERPLGVPGALPRPDQVEPLRAELRGVVRGPDGLSAGGRRDAAAARRGLDAQPRAAGRRLVPDEAA